MALAVAATLAALALSDANLAGKHVDQSDDCWTFAGTMEKSGGMISPGVCCRNSPCGVNGCWRPPEMTYHFCCKEPACRPLVIGEVKRALLAISQMPLVRNVSHLSQQAHHLAGRHLRALRQRSPGLRLRKSPDPEILPMGCDCAVAMAAAALLRYGGLGAADSEGPGALLAPTWFTHELDWTQLIESGWSPLFAVLAREPSTTARLVHTPTVPALLWNDIPETLGSLQKFVADAQAFGRSVAEAVEREGLDFRAFVSAMYHAGIWASLWRHLGADLEKRRRGRRCTAVAKSGSKRGGSASWDACVDWEYAATANFSSPRPNNRPSRSAGVSPASALPKAAVCVLGAPRTVVDTFPRIREFLVKPLKADVFYYVPFQDVVSHEMETKLQKLGPVVTVLAAPDVDAEGMRHRFQREVQDDRIYELYRYVPGPYRSPIHGEMGSVMWSYFSQSVCRRMVEAHERQRGGRRYAWVVFARADMYWTKPHPTLEVLDPRYIHVPYGQDNSFYNHGKEHGLNDRHAAIPRHLATAYLGRWEAYASGRSWEYLEPPAARGELINAEQFNLLHLRSEAAPVARFPPVAYLAMCVESPQCVHLFRGTDLGKQQWTFSAKYMPELVEVLRTTYDGARNTQRWGWTWAPVPLYSLDKELCGQPWELHSLEFACCLSPSGPVSCKWWDFLKQCRSIKR